MYLGHPSLMLSVHWPAWQQHQIRLMPLRGFRIGRGIYPVILKDSLKGGSERTIFNLTLSVIFPTMICANGGWMRAGVTRKRRSICHPTLGHYFLRVIPPHIVLTSVPTLC